MLPKSCYVINYKITEYSECLPFESELLRIQNAGHDRNFIASKASGIHACTTFMYLSVSAKYI